MKFIGGFIFWPGSCDYFYLLTIMSSPVPSGDAFFQWRREQFPIFESKIFLTHASVSPLPTRSAQAVSEYALSIAHQGQLESIHDPIYRSCKERIAALLNNGAKAEEVAFAGSTSHALGLVATSFPWKSGDNCVVFDGDFPANVVIWKNLEHTHGVEVRMVPFRHSRYWTLDDLMPLIDENTRLVTLSAINFLAGTALDITTIGRWLHERGILLCVDAIQALGAIEVDLSEADFVCADAHKWLLGPNGAAFTWFRGSVLERMHPQILGWLAIDGRENWFAYGTKPYPTAERFEPGARNYLGIVGMEASLAVLQDAGMNDVSQRVTQLRNYAANGIQATGCRLHTLPDPQKNGGIVSFQAADGHTQTLYGRLEADFILSLRNDRDGAAWIRVSPHFMNHENDIDALCDAID